jgi:hypothetical protein
LLSLRGWGDRAIYTVRARSALLRVSQAHA